MKRFAIFIFLAACILAMILDYAGRGRLYPARGFYCHWDLGYYIPMLLTLVVVARTRDKLAFRSRTVFVALQACILFGDKLIHDFVRSDMDPPLSLFALAVLSYTVGSSLLTGFIHNRRRTSRTTGTCIECGYLLRGLVEPRCPECGTRFDPKLLDKQIG